ncbi:unnamed protein product [Vitrella brassicaformis CCMP3155]|uniref:Uncharacterized protein n=2 Tax=Vitrella brassicaformis TaxID=1169539 RepID=A0A0G4F5S9_VITBC|nr:unnamed protein product [Vitrella brassicaformis CCMP3155]|eukprot:CEM07841.1 unnamed protein product [Vitrella brassicaformis CCMP3155]
MLRPRTTLALRQPSALQRIIGQPTSGLTHVHNQSRAISGFPSYSIAMPAPPPREYNPDGTPRKYRLMMWTYDHPYDWERWVIFPEGCFHTYYYGTFARDLPWYTAWWASFPLYATLLPTIVFFYLLASFGVQGGAIGVKPKRYTVEWQEAEKERDRAENANPCTRYLERRRKERGSNWLLADFMPKHPYWPYMRNHHDTELLREMERKKARALRKAEREAAAAAAEEGGEDEEGGDDEGEE